MRVYASELQSALLPLLGAEDRLSISMPRPPCIHPRIVRYGVQYLLYPIQARSTPADIFHITDHSYGHLLWTLDPRRSIVTVHDVIALEARHGFVQRYNLRGVCRAARILCDSEATRRKFLRLSGYAPERTVVTPLGVEERFFVDPAGDPFGRLGIPPGRYILHIGHTMPYKNIPGLLRIFSILAGSMGLDLRLLRAGGPFSPEQERLARKLGLQERIFHARYLPPDQLPDLYHCAELLLFPSLDEGFGFPVLEAFASGLPVVASDQGAIPEVAGDAALLADPRDETAMAQHVRTILQNADLRARLREAGRQRARQFHWERTARQTLEVYRQVHQGIRP